MYRITDHQTIDRVLSLIADGVSDYEVARRSGVSRSTVQNWRRFGLPKTRQRQALTRPIDDVAYSYLLGVYLGDGWVGQAGRSWVLQIYLDASYPEIIWEVAGTIPRVSTGQVRAQLRSDKSCVVLQSACRDWSNLFPQHGPGKKHERKIELVDWQLLITHRYTQEFVRGLFHTDGSRCINRFSVKLPSGRVRQYAYPRYFFTNYSEDIRRIFCEHCDVLGIRWTQSNARNISVSDRDSVSLLDTFVGPKS